ncbi:MAG: TatD family hydrolase [Clostridia bacterium]|nr:TatD family hydrolase [Clostridia bacterium]
MKLFDTHTHLLDEQFELDRNELIPALPQAGVYRVLEACCEAGDIGKINALVRIYPHVYGSAGVHPHAARTVNAHVLGQIERALENERIVAVGEIGLDYHYDYAPRETQREAFAAQLAIAQAHKKPVLVHDREAHGDCMSLIRAHREGLCGIMHCYSGSYEDAKRYIDLGFLIALGGALTFKNASRLAEIAAKLPLESMVIETDCPYMAPAPHRGERNDPRLMRLTLERLAAIRGISPGEAAAAVTANANRLLGLPED